MVDFEARRVIEALRSGISSRAAGHYFSSARQEFITQISNKLNEICENKSSDGLIFSGRYGEGKTHLLNTVFNMAHSNNMAVSIIPLSKETPFDKLYLVYQKLLGNTYLPKRFQPGFLENLINVTPNSPLASEILPFAAKQLEVDKLFYLLRSYFKTGDMDEKYILQADLEGDFVSNADLKQIYKRIFNEKAEYNVNFSKTKHMGAYFSMIGRLFLAMGLNGWVILFDETELIGRLSKKTRLKAYKNMAEFLFPSPERLATYTIFAVTSSYIEDVIEGKHEFDNLDESGFEPEDRTAADKTLRALLAAKQLQPLNKTEISEIMKKLLDFYKRAYDWQIDIDMDEIIKRTDNRGFLLRTRIRAAVECLDQLYQYNNFSDIKINPLGQVSYEEEIPPLDDII